MDKVAYALLSGKINNITENVGQIATEATEAWLEDNIDPESGYVLDNTLAIADAAAPAKTVGDALASQAEKIDDITDQLGESKTATGEIVLIPDAPAEKPKQLVVEIPYVSGGLSSMTMRFHKRNMLTQTGTITSAGLTYTPQSDGSINIKETATGNSRYGFYGSTAYINADNVYNLPKGTYTVFAYSMFVNEYRGGAFHVYSGTSTTKIADFNSSAPYSFTISDAKSGRVACQYSSGSSFGTIGANYKVFMGVGSGLTVDDFDEPSTTRVELSASFGSTIYGGTVDLINGSITSKYASDGTELVTPETISFTPPTIPTLYEGYNTIWASVLGSVVTVGYGISRLDGIDNTINNLQTEIESVDSKADKALDRISETFCTLAMFEKIGIIGDSYATGSLYIPNGSSASYVGTYNNLSWGKNLQRLFGNTVKFYAHGGLSTKTWLTDTTNGIAALEADAVTSPCNLYWFGLGINDVSLYNSSASYLGDITDISGHSSGTAWAETFYGNVGQIIERVQAASQYSKIIISSFVGYRPKAQIAGDIALNNALEEIAEYYGLPFIDLKDDDFYMSSYYSGNILGKHPIAMLYSGMAMANARLFGKAVMDNQTYFKDYHMGTPIPDPEPDDPT